MRVLSAEGDDTAVAGADCCANANGAAAISTDAHAAIRRCLRGVGMGWFLWLVMVAADVRRSDDSRLHGGLDLCQRVRERVVQRWRHLFNQLQGFPSALGINLQRTICRQ